MTGPSPTVTRRSGSNPRLSMAYDNRGNAWAGKHEPDKAIADFDEAIRLDPRNAWAHGIAPQSGGGSTSRARPSPTSMRRSGLIPGMPGPTANAVGFAWKEKNMPGPWPTSAKPSGCDPSDPWTHNGRAWIRATCPQAQYRDGKQAVEAATRACELTDWKNPNSSTLWPRPTPSRATSTPPSTGRPGRTPYSPKARTRPMARPD